VDVPHYSGRESQLPLTRSLPRHQAKLRPDTQGRDVALALAFCLYILQHSPEPGLRSSTCRLLLRGFDRWCE
jgi:hypothetical protein